MNEVLVREGNTGILYLTYPDGRNERYIPNYDLDEAREHLLEFQELEEAGGRRLKNAYGAAGYNWYPVMVSYLYWHVFFAYVKYKPLIHEVIGGALRCKFENEGVFRSLITMMATAHHGSTRKTRLFFRMVQLNNTNVVRKSRASILFYRFSLQDFRSLEIQDALERLNVKYVYVLPPPRFKDILRNLVLGRPYYFFGGPRVENRFQYKYDLSRFGAILRHVLQRAIDEVEWEISGYIAEYERHRDRLMNCSFRTFFGFDDCNGYIFPILYACHSDGIKTIAIQHGAYVKRHAGYVMEGIDKRNYRWFDKIIVWGQYWKDHLLAISTVHDPGSIVVGSNKLSWDYHVSRKPVSNPMSVLIPYEFLTNTFKVGRYIERLLDLGYDIYFKPRSDEPLEDQIEAYCLSDAARKRLKIVPKLDKSFMDRIDIITGTMTTLIYELLPYNKIVWIFETEYRHLEDLVEGGYAHKVRYEDLDRLDPSYFTKSNIERELLFSGISLEQTLKEHVLAPSN